MNLKSKIRSIPDYPQPGVIFRDITTLLEDAEGFAHALEGMVANVARFKPTKIAGIEARGFIVGGAIAKELGLGFVAVRKQGKLPWKTMAEEYELEYGSDQIEIHIDSFAPSDRVVLVDDLIATGGTALAAARLVQRTEAQVLGACFIVDLPELGGSTKLKEVGIDPVSLVEFDGL